MPQTKPKYGKSLARIFDNSFGAIMEFFVEKRFNDHSMNEVRDVTGVSHRHCQRVVYHFVKAGLLDQTRTVGKVTKMWKLKPCEQSFHLIKFHNQTLSMLKQQDKPPK